MCEPLRGKIMYEGDICKTFKLIDNIYYCKYDNIYIYEKYQEGDLNV